MRHTSIKLDDSPIEFINVMPLNPLISKCQIKVCYVSDEPNRNRSVITKEVAKQMANSLPGSPIVGFFNESSEDFEEHNRIIDVSNGKFEIKDTTKPYGFVDLGAKVWFQKFLDDNKDEREYLMTEGYLWTGQYPECKRILTEGNNQSMELDENTISGNWTKDANGDYKFFIINEAIISKLCILGEDCEPCFEGASIEAPLIQFSFDDGFKEQLFSMMNELKQLIKKGGEKVFNQYTIDIGDPMYRVISSYLKETYPNTTDDEWLDSNYFIKSVYEDGDQKFAILQERATGKLFRMNFTYTETDFSAEPLVEVEAEYVPVENSSFSLEDTQNFFKENKETEDKSEKEDLNESDKESEGDESAHEEEKKYSLEEIPEYVELQAQYSELEAKYNNLAAELESKNGEIAELTEFKLKVDRKEKQQMIDSFYMLSDEDKKEVVDNIDTYSLGDIEAKLSIICVRNKVSFSEDNNAKGATTYHLESAEMHEDANVPDWVKATREVAKIMN